MDVLGFFLVIIVFVAIFGLYIVYLIKPAPKKKQSQSFLDKNLVQQKWHEIQEMLNQGGPANYRQVIFEGDKLVDYVLKSRVGGETMGERLKNARTLFSPQTYDNLWTAHKIRNKLAHEADFEGLSSDARLAVRHFEKALKELGVI